MGLIKQLAFWRKAKIDSSYLLSDWYEKLPHRPFKTLIESSKAINFQYEQLGLPKILHANNLVIYNGVRSPGSTALHIEHIVIYGNKKAFRMLGMYLIAAALRIKYDQSVQLNCLNEQVSPCKGLIIGLPRQSQLETSLQLAPSILTECSWSPSLPAGKLEHWVKELDDTNYPKDHLPWARLGSVAEIYSEHYRPRQNQPIFVHLQGTLASLCWLGKGLLNFALEDHPCHTWSLLNYGGHSSLASGSAELRFVSPGGLDIPGSIAPWLNTQIEHKRNPLASVVPLAKSPSPVPSAPSHTDASSFSHSENDSTTVQPAAGSPSSNEDKKPS